MASSPAPAQRLIPRESYSQFRGNGEVPKGQWAPVVYEEKVVARIGCPECGVNLIIKDTIDGVGNVNMRVGCFKNGCRHHAMVHLEGWGD